MTTGVTRELRVALERLDELTRSILEAAAAAEPEAIRDGIDARAEAVQDLRNRVDETGALGPDASEAIRQALAATDRHAADALAALTALREASRHELEALSRGVAALRSYRPPVERSSVLDRTR